MFGILGWLILGLLAGVIAKAVMPGRDPGGVLMTIVIGIVGAVIGGFLGQSLLGYGRAGDVNSPGAGMSLVLAVLGSVILLALYRVFTRRRVVHV
jgi:uncharacterized membrane protein YeaQ/YmgE (transglycosylase-associated protein family)